MQTRDEMMQSNTETWTGQQNRREFLSTMVIAAGVLAAGSVPGVSAMELISTPKLTPGKGRGISQRAYRQAKKRAQALVAQMTLEEKIGQLGAQAPAIPRLKLPAYNYYTGEALHGLTNRAPATSFPVPLALSASWNPELAFRVYTAVSDEARAYDNREKIGLSYYSPLTLNLHRDPRWGRCEEAPGEDPCLAATLGVQVVRGMQGDNPNYLKTTACSKHFICNNTDDDRTGVSASVDSRNFWEYYTRAYRATVLEGDVFTVMGAYSALNGIPCCANHFLLTELLRGHWGFRGYVTSDCDAIDNIFEPHHYAANKAIASAQAVTAGCDLNCGGTLQANLKAAVDQELIGEHDIGVAVTRLMTVRCLLGLFDPAAKVSYTQIPFAVVDSAAHRALALEAARQSIVLLKNEADFLPLDKTTLKKVAVIGPLADTCHLGGYSGMPGVRISPYAGIAASLDAPIHRPYLKASQMVNSGGGVRLRPSSEGESSLGYIRDGSWVEFPQTDFSGKTEFRARVASGTHGGRIEVHLDQLNGPEACALAVPGTGGWQNWTNVSASLAGITGKHSLFLKFRGGKGSLFNIERVALHPVTPPPSPKPEQPEVIFKPGCTVTGEKDNTMFREAVETAREADVVVLVCGVNQEVDRESHDRQTIGLSGAQPELIQAVYAANPRTVLVLSTNNTVAIPWEQAHLPAIICAVCAGQAQGQAIAEVLVGDYNPGGKLPCTWYRSLDQLPPFHDYDIRKGRTYLYFKGDPLYHFGHGLSYTSFRLDQLKISVGTLGRDEKTMVSVMIANTGQRAGVEVVQLYITPPPSPVKRPEKQLAGFCRVELRPGEQRKVTFELPFTEPAFWYWDETSRRFVLQPGKARVLVGNSSVSLRLSADLILNAPAEIRAAPDILDSSSLKHHLS